MPRQAVMRHNGNDMMMFMAGLSVCVFALILLVSGFVPRRNTISAYELERRKSHGDKIAEKALLREELIVDILSLQRVIGSLLLVILVTLLVASFGWPLGIAL